MQLLADAMDESSESTEIKIPCTQQESIEYFIDLYSTICHIFRHMTASVSLGENGEVIGVVLTHRKGICNEKTN